MKHSKRLTALLLAGLMLLALLGGCKKQEGSSSSSASGSGSSSTGNVDVNAITDICLYAANLSSGTVLATVNGEEITAGEILYWVITDCDDIFDYYNYYYGYSEIPWDNQLGETGKTVAAYILEDALEGAALYRLVISKAKAEGLSVGQEDLDAIQQSLSNLEAQLKEDGGGVTAQQYLWQSMLTPELYDQYCQCEYLYDVIANARYGEGTAGYPSDETVKQYIADTGAYQVKHILLAKVNTSTYEALDEATVAEKKSKAEDLLAQLRASGDPLTLFDELMKANSEDPGLATNPDGYLAFPGQMYEEFEQGALALKEGEISDIVETDVGYHIILRLPLDIDPSEYRQEYIYDKMDEEKADWMESADIQAVDAYNNLDVKAIYQAMNDYRTALAQ